MAADCADVVPVAILGAAYGSLYIWAKYADWATALKNGLITNDQAHAIDCKQPMLNITDSSWCRWSASRFLRCTFYLLNSWSKKRDADPQPNGARWRTRFENLSGFGVVFYAACSSFFAIDWVMSLDPTWYSTIYGFQYPGGTAVYVVLPLAILTLIRLSKAEPIKSTSGSPSSTTWASWLRAS